MAISTKSLPRPKDIVLKRENASGRTNPPHKVAGPNVLFIMSDQHRYDWMGCAGLDALDTPNMDNIARSGILFSQATCSSPLCAPSRAALATGLRPPRCHVLDNSYSLPLDHWTVYQQFRRHGYRTALFGKLDLHKPQAFNGEHGDLPVLYELGFTDPFEAEGKQHAAHRVMIENDDGSRERLLLGPYQHYLDEKGLLDRFSADYDYRNTQHAHYAEPSVLACEDFEDLFIGRHACSWLRAQNDDSPWFAFVSFVGPHLPFDAPAEYLERYADADLPEHTPQIGTPRASFVEHKQQELTRGTDAETLRQMRQNYAGAITAIDDAIGDMLAVLDEKGQRENTIIVYCADHGEMLGDLGLVGKSVHYEPALRVPLIISGGGIPQGQVSDALVEIFDLTPTLLDLTGLPVPADLDARSFVDVLHGKADAHRSAQVSELPFTRCVRAGGYKAIINPNDLDELYDLEQDPGEQRNIAAECPELLAKLKKRYQQEVTGGMVLNA